MSRENTGVPEKSLLMSRGRSRWIKAASFLGSSFLFTVTSLSALAVFFIFFFIAKDAIPFLRSWEYVKQFFTSTEYYPSGHPPIFGVLALFYGSAIVTLGAILVAVPLGIPAAVCLSDLLPFKLRQIVKPVIELLAAIPSVAYGFFAFVILSPLLEKKGGPMLSVGMWIVVGPTLLLLAIVLSDLFGEAVPKRARTAARAGAFTVLGGGSLFFLIWAGRALYGLEISSGTNALNVSIILGIMALPTVISVSEDALQAAGREIREASYALGATRMETIIKAVIPASISGILAAVILGLMRAVGETMVVWMASGNAAKVPEPFYNLLEPVRTLTATIAGDMGEADQSTGSYRYHVLFALAFCLLTFSFVLNLVSEWIVVKSRKKLGK